MDDYVKLKLFSKVLKTKPDFLESNFDENYLSYESLEGLSKFLNQFRGVLSIEAEGDDLFRMYELIKFNYDALLNGTLIILLTPHKKNLELIINKIIPNMV
jgi:hypothetical protein